MSEKTKIIFTLILLGMADVVLPIPIIGLILVYVVIQKPPWFRDLVQRVYEG